jgi:hypothetical protein
MKHAVKLSFGTYFIVKNLASTSLKSRHVSIRYQKVYPHDNQKIFILFNNIC